MIPIGDNLPTLRRPVVTYLILAAMFAVWVFVQGAGFENFRLAASVCDLGLVPGELTRLAPLGQAVPLGSGLACVVDDHSINYLTPVISMFLHGSWGHLLGNALFFWVFGNNVEDSMGHLRFLAFYLICGLAAGFAHVLVDSHSPVPTVGASGAISGVLGGYLLLYPRARIRMLFLFFAIPIQAWLVLLWWFVWQVIAGLPQLMTVEPDVSGGVAVWAHVGGFVTGVVLIKLFANPRYVAEHRTAIGVKHGYLWR
ncbi:MAG: rhomboid family intramembrane serine protease [Gemmatimonadaceae bacterium]